MIYSQLKTLLTPLTQCVVCLLLTTFCVNTAFADVSGDLGGFFNALGYEGNVTQAHAYQGQVAGYYSGGSLFLRQRIQNLQLMHVDLPSLTSGCSGIDAYLGAFSFISKDQIVTLIKNIMSNAKGYMFDLALETTVPELKSVKDFMQKLATAVNNTNINSCHAAQAFVGGLWPKTQATQQKICKDLGTQNNTFSDWAEARQGCSTVGDFNKVLNAAQTDPRYKDQVTINKNLVWDSLSQNPLVSNDTELKELLMSLSGTIIFDGQGQPTPVPSLADNKNLIKALLYGGQAKLLSCEDTDKCLKLDSKQITVSESGALVHQVTTLIIALYNSIKSDSGITDKEKGFITMTPIPIAKFITVLVSLKQDLQAYDLTQYSEVIAQGLLAQYLHENLDLVSQSLKLHNFPPVLQTQMQQKIQAAEVEVAAMQTAAYRKIQNTMGLVRNMQFVERQYTTEVDSTFEAARSDT